MSNFTVAAALGRVRVAFQLAGGSRDHYTSRAKFILFDMTNLRPCSQPAYSVLVLKTFHYRERLINERNN